MKEFVFLNDLDNEIVLPDEIEILDKVTKDRYLVSNSDKVGAEIYAPEINFYKYEK